MERAWSPETLAGRYRLEALLGAGGAGTVYRVFDTQVNAFRALKVLHPSRSGADNLTRFKREFRAASRLDHPHCLRVHELASDGERWFYTMEFVAGGSLRLAEWRRWQDLVPLALQVLAGLDHIHAKQIVHRDIKPQNILIDRPSKGDPPVVKLADFGISKVSEVDQAPLGQVVGSLAYLTPEQLEGGPVDPRTDLYALGLVLYEALAGQNPFHHTLEQAAPTTRLMRELFALRAGTVVPPLSILAPAVPARLGAIVMRLLQAEPEGRYPTAALVHEDLAAWWLEQPEAPALAATPPLARAAYLAAPRLVGRVNELDFVDRFCERASDAAHPTSPFVCFIEGSAGTGKSRLVAEVARRARAAGMRVEAGTWRAEAGGRWPLGWMLHLAAGATDLPATAKALTFTATDGGRDNTLPLASLPALAPGNQDDLFVDFSGRQWRVYRQIADALIESSAAQPLLVVLEDAHWADEPSLALLSSLVRSVTLARAGGAPTRITIILTHRPTSADGGLTALRQAAEALAIAGRVELHSLDVEQASELVASMLMCPVTDEVRRFSRRLLVRAQANPLHLGQTLHLLLSTGALVRRGADWDLGERVLAGARLPETVTEAIGDRAARLSAEAKRLLATAAVIGREFELEVLQGSARMDLGIALDCLDEAIRAGFVLEREDAGDVFLFTHDRFRDAIQERLSAADRSDLHERTAAAIEQRYGSDPLWSAALAHHHSGAGKPARAYEHSVRAGEHAMATFSFAQASENYGKALRYAAEAQLAVPLALTERHADACLQAGRYDEALEGFHARLSSVEDPIGQAEIRRKCAELEFRRGNTARAEVELEEVLRTLGFQTPPASQDVMPPMLPTLWTYLSSLPPKRPFPPTLPPDEARRRMVLVRASLWLSEVLYFRDWGRAAFYGVSAFRAARGLGSCIELALVMSGAGLVASTFGFPGMAERYHGRARIHLGAKSPIDRAWAHLLRALSMLCHADVDEALAELSRADQILEKTHEPFRLREILVLRADVLCRRGDFGAAEECVNKILRLAEELQDERGRGWGLYVRGQSASRLGRRDEAQTSLSKAAFHTERGGDITYKLHCDASRAFDLLLEGEVDEATALASAAAAEYAQRRLVCTIQPVDGIFLAAAAVMLKRDGRLSPALRRQVRHVRLFRWYRARCLRLTRPLFWAGGAAIDVAGGKLARGTARFEKAIRAAKAAGLLGTLLDIYALGARVFPEPQRAHYADRHAELSAQLASSAPVKASSAA